MHDSYVGHVKTAVRRFESAKVGRFKGSAVQQFRFKRFNRFERFENQSLEVQQARGSAESLHEALCDRGSEDQTHDIVIALDARFDAIGFQVAVIDAPADLAKERVRPSIAFE